MELSGMRLRHAPHSLQDIFDNDELGLLEDVKAVQKAATDHQLLHSLYSEIADFFRRHGKLPDMQGALDEKRLARKWQAALDNKEHREILLAEDELNLISERPSDETVVQQAVIQVQSLDDIFANDTLGLLDTGNTEIFHIRHVRDNSSKPYTGEETAQRRPCKDFWRFEAWFKQIHAALQNGTAHMERLKTETFLQPGDAFLLGGVLCYIADYADTEARQSPRTNLRLRVVYENGTETDILTRSLARAVYKDENGRKIILHETIEFSDGLESSSKEDLITGYLYVLKAILPKPELARFKNLHKIGFTTGAVEDRIANAENDIAFLESPVRPVLSFECRNINPHTFERLIHAFFAGQRLNLKLVGKDGKQYTPYEWFDVGLDVIEQAADLIVRGEISRYRMDNTVGKIVLKENR